MSVYGFLEMREHHPCCVILPEQIFTYPKRTVKLNPGVDFTQHTKHFCWAECETSGHKLSADFNAL